jgi:hypothetical protein
MTTTADEIRQQLQQVLVVLRPYAQSTGQLDLADVRIAIGLAEISLERAKHLAARLP